MRIEWNEDLNTNIAEIDEQHRELFDRVNRLLDACNKGEGRSEVDRMIGFFEDYVVTHFSDEEAAMVRSSYAGYRLHKKEHEEFMVQIGELKRKFQQDGGRIDVVLLTVRTSVDWLVNHIRRADKSVAAHLNAR